jgi:predicted RNase H-like HicB family nuclease
MDIPIKVVVHSDEEGKLWAEVPGLPGCATEGETLEELRSNLREAIEGCFGATQDEALRDEECEPGEVVTL